jgi:hypothetical protein
MSGLSAGKLATNLSVGRYFTGEPCKYGDIAERDVENGACLKCRALIYETGVGKGKRERQSVNCKQCEARFPQKRSDQIFCSPTCRLEFFGAHPVSKSCAHCCASFVARPNAIFCSPKCRIAHWVPKLKGRNLFAE